MKRYYFIQTNHFLQIVRPAKRRLNKVLDDDEDEEMEVVINNKEKNAENTHDTTKRFQSEVTSMTHKEN